MSLVLSLQPTGGIDDVPSCNSFRNELLIRRSRLLKRDDRESQHCVSPDKHHDKMLDLADLHDAILESVAIQVDAGTIALVLTPVEYKDAAKRITLIARQWRAFSCPKQEPWGHGATWYVNEARGPSVLESGVQHLELEMQSGDVIEIDAASLERIDDFQANDPD